MAAANPSDLQKPPLNQKVLDPKNGLLSQAWNAWFTGLGTVASWVVRGTLSAGSAVISGTLNVTGVFTMGTAVPTPANGQIGAGDATWIEIGSGGTAPAFQSGWINSGGALATAAFRKTASGIVEIKGFIQLGASGSIVFTLPAGYRPSKEIWLASANSDASIPAVHITPAGLVSWNFGGGPPAAGICCSFYAEA